MTNPAGPNDRRRPPVSVIIRSKDRVPWLLQLLERLREQTVQDFEIVVIDSTVDPAQRAMLAAVDDSRLRIFHTPPRGCPAAANEGIRRARGEILVFIDDDDLPLGRDWLACHLRNFEDPDCVGVNGFHVFPAEHRTPEGSLLQRFRFHLLLSHGPFKEPYCFAYDDRRKVGIDYLMGGNASIRRSAALLGGGWDEFLDYHDEHSLFLRLGKRKPREWYLVYDPEAKMEIRKDVPGGLDARFSGSTTKRVDTLARYFLWVVGREYPGRIYGLAGVFVPYFALLGGIAGAHLAGGRDASRTLEFARGLAYAPWSLARQLLARRPPPHDGFAEERTSRSTAGGPGTGPGDAVSSRADSGSETPTDPGRHTEPR